MSINLYLFTVEVLLFFVVRVDAQCGPGFEGPNSGACVACPAGKFKNTTGNMCSTCPQNTFSLSGALLCTTCPAGFTSPNGSTVSSDCCDPNTTFAKNLYDALSSATQTQVSQTGDIGLTPTYIVRVSSVPVISFSPGTDIPPIPPAYISSGGYNGQAFLRFSKISSVSGVNYLSTRALLRPDDGITIVTVVCFLQSIKGVFWSMLSDGGSNTIEIILSDTLQLCVKAREGHWADYFVCTSTAVPINVWLQVSYTYHRNRWPRQILKVVYLSTTEGTVVLSGEGYSFIMRDGGTLGSRSAIGYSTSGTCAGPHTHMWPTNNPACDRPNFDLAGFYFIHTLASDADITVLFEAIATGSQIYYDRTNTCQCNAGFGGTGRSDCKSCGPGKYKHTIRSGSCLDCLGGTYSAQVQATTISTCTACPQGYGDSCIGCTVLANCSCNVASYGPNLGPCLACPSNSGAACRGCTVLTGCTCNPGFTGPNGGPCTACPVGSYKIASGNASCTNCTAGQYSTTLNATAAATCLACPVNSVSPIQSSHISQCACAMGYTGQNGGTCTACAITTYKNQTGNATCAACPTASNSPAASIAIAACTCNLGFTGPNGGPCTACLAGTYKTAIGSAICTNCLVNQYSVNLAATAVSTCLACPVNSNSPIQSVSIQNCSCNLGFTGPNGGPCTVCPALTFKNTIGTAACTSCPVNTGASCSACNALTACTCNARFYGPNGGPCLQCPSNTGESCSGCTVLTGCMCNPGFTGPNGGNCTACLAGTFKTTSGSLTCTTCAAGTFSTAINATIATTCLACPANSGASCSGCPISTSCTCNQGFTGPNGGPCSNCLVGTFKATTGNGTCTDCSTGSYTDMTAASTCLTCPVNSNSPIQSRSIQNCTCNLGFTGPNGGTCSQCAIGTFKPTTGSAACTVCSAGTYSVNAAVTTCLSCTANSFSPVSSTTFTSCTCNLGYTGPGGPSDPVVTVISSNLARSCGVASNTACSTSQSTAGLASSFAVDNDVNTLSQTLGTQTSVTQWFSIDFGKQVRVTSFELVILRTHEVDYHRNFEVRIGNVTSFASNPLCYIHAGALSTLGVATNNWVRTISCTTTHQGQYFYFVNPFVGGFTNYVSLAEIRPIGSWSIIPPRGCFMCVIGTYKNTTGSTNCTACPVGLTSPAASTSIAACIVPNCNAGYTGPSGGPCAVCVAGKYKVATGSAACIDCGIGTYSSTLAATAAAACVACPNNTFSGVIGISNVLSCQSCQPNAVSVAGSVSQEYCYCKAGYAHAEGEFRCNACTPGTYNSHLARKTCSNCTIGMYSVHYNATGPETCQACPVGQWSSEGSANCNLCPLYSSTLGTSGSIFDCVCDAGYTGPAGSTCTPCSAGKYKTATGSAACTNCGSGTYSSTIAATAAAACLACPADTISPATSTSSAACISPACNAGYTGPDGICSTCAAGTYKVGIGSASCTPCVTGKYSITPAATAETVCLSCPVNSNSPSQSSVVTVCKCNVGYSGPDGDVCAPCAPGTYKDTIGPATCTSCPSFSGDACMSCVSTAMCVCTAYNSQNCTDCVSMSPPASLSSDDCVCGPGQYDESQ